MGAEYLIACHDCEEYVDLGKWPSWYYRPNSKIPANGMSGMIRQMKYTEKLLDFLKKHESHNIKFYDDEVSEEEYDKVIGYGLENNPEMNEDLKKEFSYKEFVGDE